MNNQAKFILGSCGLIIGASAWLLNKKIVKSTPNRRYWVRPWLASSNYNKGNMNLVEEFNYPRIYLNYLRMDEPTFNKLLKLVENDITKENTNMRQSISAKHQLIVTLRFLATGNSYRSLMFEFRISESTISLFIPKCPTTTSEWHNIVQGFNETWNFPNCIGAIDGKHIVFRAPASAGSTFYNYKGENSIVLLAMVDSQYNFIYVDVGTNGRISDGGVFRKTTLYAAITNNSINIPEDTTLPQRNKMVPHAIVADAPFPLQKHILKPYPFRNMSNEQRIFNYRLSRARRVVENAFGILANRFRIFLTTIQLSANKVQDITLACCALHNFLSQECKTTYRSGDGFDEKNNFRNRLSQQIGNRPKQAVVDTREEFLEYFNGVGSVPWQNNAI